MRHWFRRVSLFLFASSIFLACAGAAYQAIGNWRDARRFPQRGRSVDVGGLKLNLNCNGSGRPIVILESGLGMSSIGWIKIQPEIAKYTRVCSYDRAGYGWSEAGKEPRTSLQIAKELKALMDGAGEREPYVLVGASFGGFNVRVFNGLYPAAVAGVVLLDASHEDQQERVDGILSSAAREERIKNEERERRQEWMNQIIAPVMVHLGIERLQASLRPLDTSPPPFGLTRALLEEFNYLDQQLKTRQTVAAESAARKESAKQVRSAGGMGDRPLIVLTAGRMEFRPDPLMTPDKQDQLRNLWINILQAEEARLSTRGRQIVLKDSGHIVQFERPDAVENAVHEVWSEAAKWRER
jgi:pimeloyl-ACP methyl ester carboxylesterase